MAEIDVPLTERALVAHFQGRECYRRTRFIAVAGSGGHALIEVELADRGPLFSPATDVTLLAGPDETVYVRRPEIDTGVPSSSPGSRVSTARRAA